jgi:hypothetical protein
MIKKADTVNDITSAMSPLRVDLSQKLYNELASVMNEVHGTDFSNKFWKLIVQAHVNAVVSRKKHLDSADLYRKPDLYPINGYDFPDFKEKFKYGLIHTVKHFINRFNRKKIEELLQKQNEFRLGFPEVLNLDKDIGGVALPLYYPVFFGRGEKNKRAKVNRIAERYKDIYYRNLIRQLPQIYVEHFKKIFESIPLAQPEKKTLHVHISFGFYKDLLIAKYVENGSRLIWYQHGSSYGEFRGDSAHHFEHSVSDEYRSWGWEIKEKDVAWKAYRMELFSMQYQKYTRTGQFDLMLCFPQMNGEYRKLYSGITDFLLEHLDADIYRRILARPRRSNKIHSHASQLSFIENERIIKSSGLPPMMKEMSECRAVLQMEVPSTNFLECLYVDHPTIGLLRNDQPTEVIQPYYDFFLKEGVLHEDLESLASHLNSIEIETWWEELQQKEMYLSFKDTFIRKV